MAEHEVFFSGDVENPTDIEPFVRLTNKVHHLMNRPSKTTTGFVMLISKYDARPGNEADSMILTNFDAKLNRQRVIAMLRAKADELESREFGELKRV